MVVLRRTAPALRAMDLRVLQRTPPHGTLLQSIVFLLLAALCSPDVTSVDATQNQLKGRIGGYFQDPLHSGSSVCSRARLIPRGRAVPTQLSRHAAHYNTLQGD